MIFVTVGTQLPFPRLIDAVDALSSTLAEEIVAQVGPDRSQRTGILSYPMLRPDEIATYMSQARVVVAHAGIGTILECQSLGKPLVIVPRRFDLGEHRNDHQMATAHQLVDLNGLHVAWDVDDLGNLLARTDLEPLRQSDGKRLAPLLQVIGDFIDDGPDTRS